MKRFDIYVNLERTKFNVEVLNSLDETEESFTMDLYETRILHEKLTEALGLNEETNKDDPEEGSSNFEDVDWRHCGQRTTHSQHGWGGKHLETGIRQYQCGGTETEMRSAILIAGEPHVLKECSVGSKHDPHIWISNNTKHWCDAE